MALKKRKRAVDARNKETSVAMKKQKFGGVAKPRSQKNEPLSKPQQQNSKKFPCFAFFEDQCNNINCQHSHNKCDYKAFCKSGRPRPDEDFMTFLEYSKNIVTPVFTTAEISAHQQRKSQAKAARKKLKLVRHQRRQHARSVLNAMRLSATLNQAQEMPENIHRVQCVRWGMNTTHAITWSCPSRPDCGQNTKRITVAEGRARAKARRQRRCRAK